MATIKKIILLTLTALVMVGCRNTRKYVVVHHKNLRDTVSATSYIHYIDNKTATFHKAGSFTQVEYIKVIE